MLAYLSINVKHELQKLFFLLVVHLGCVPDMMFIHSWTAAGALFNNDILLLIIFIIIIIIDWKVFETPNNEQ